MEPDKQGNNSEKVGKNHPPKDTKWKPGQSGNPAGRPPKDETITSLIKDLLEQHPDWGEGKTYRELIALAIVDASAKGDTRAWGELLDRLEGKVANKHQISSMTVSVGDEYARRGLEAVKKDIEDRKRTLEASEARLQENG